MSLNNTNQTKPNPSNAAGRVVEEWRWGSIFGHFASSDFMGHHLQNTSFLRQSVAVVHVESCVESFFPLLYRHCVLHQGVLIGKNTHIGSNTNISNSIIGKNCTIGKMI